MEHETEIDPTDTNALDERLDAIEAEPARYGETTRAICEAYFATLETRMRSAGRTTFHGQILVRDAYREFAWPRRLAIPYNHNLWDTIAFIDQLDDLIGWLRLFRAWWLEAKAEPDFLDTDDMPTPPRLARLMRARKET